jgi:DNA-binding CsgD family transcriptional regulator
MQMIAPRVKSAFLTSDLLDEYMIQVELLGNVIASAGFGLVLVRANRQIVCANDAAEKLMRASSGLRYEYGCICAPDSKTARKLQSLISAASRPIVEAVPGGSIILRNRDGLVSLVVHVLPLSPPSTVLPPDNERPVAGLFIVDCQRGTADRVDVFADLFELTPAETRVLAQLISGEGLTIAARRLNIARSTARSHLDHILQKTGTHRQAELVRVFFETTIPWDGSVTTPNRTRRESFETLSSRRSDNLMSCVHGRCPEGPVPGAVADRVGI